MTAAAKNNPAPRRSNGLCITESSKRSNGIEKINETKIEPIDIIVIIPIMVNVFLVILFLSNFLAGNRNLAYNPNATISIEESIILPATHVWGMK